MWLSTIYVVFLLFLHESGSQFSNEIEVISTNKNVSTAVFLEPHSKKIGEIYREDSHRKENSHRKRKRHGKKKSRKKSSKMKWKKKKNKYLKFRAYTTAQSTSTVATTKGSTLKDSDIGIAIYGKCSPPRNPSVTNVSRMNITLKWLEPELYSKNSSIMYVVEKQVETGWIEIGRLGKPEIVVSHLIPGHEYLFQITARSMEANSNPIRVKYKFSVENYPKTLPGPPGLPITSPSSWVPMKLFWTAPYNDGGDKVTGYKIEKKAGMEERWTTVEETNDPRTNVQVKGLIAGKSYVFRVTAKNSLGLGIPSKESEIYAPVPQDEAGSTVHSSSQSGATTAVSSSGQSTMSTSGTSHSDTFPPKFTSMNSTYSGNVFEVSHSSVHITSPVQSTTSGKSSEATTGTGTRKSGDSTTGTASGTSGESTMSTASGASDESTTGTGTRKSGDSTTGTASGKSGDSTTGTASDGSTTGKSSTTSDKTTTK